MSARPEILFGLFTEAKVLDGIGPKTQAALEKAGAGRVRDILYALPTGVIDRRPRPSIKGLLLPIVATVEVEIGQHRPGSGRAKRYRILVHDAETEFEIVYFNASSQWLQKTYPVGQRRIVSGKLELFDGLAQMVHPDHVLRPGEYDLPEFEPVYPLHAGITQRTMGRAATSAISKTTEMPEWIDPGVLDQKGWPDWREALVAAHNPVSPSDAVPTTPARQRLAYDEFLAHQATLALARAHRRVSPGVATQGDGHLRAAVLKALPFDLTGAQTRAVAEIVEDMAQPERMNRLLQGDVGAGKTLVALFAALAVIEAGGQAAIMAPTEILARQHVQGLQKWAEVAGVRLDVLTGRDKGKDRAAKLEALASGDTGIIIGTHALFQPDVVFADLRLAIVDEQHRFGVRQRMDLGEKGEAVDVLVMTATPIPRSLALSHYGDMEVSVLDEKPPGRQPVETVLVASSRLDAVVERMEAAVAEGRQAYWVCPLVTESLEIEATAAEARYLFLKKTFGEKVGLVHGQLPAAEKDAAMADFVAGKTRILVATTVIEVGVDVPAASIMVIEGAEGFGLAQLHQLRGRVGRGSDASTCLLMYRPPLTETAEARLRILRETEDGFVIAEEDLRIRGAGDLLGLAQSGLPRFVIADPESQSGLMALAQSDARALIERDPHLRSKRGEALRVLLFLMEQDKAFRFLSVG